MTRTMNLREYTELQITRGFLRDVRKSYPLFDERSRVLARLHAAGSVLPSTPTKSMAPEAIKHGADTLRAAIEKMMRDAA